MPVSSLSNRFLIALATLSALAAPCLAGGDTVLLQPAQLKSLGIAVQAVDSAGGGGQGSLPGRVTVPNEQMRVVAAPVAGMVETLAVAPGSPVKRGQVVARLASPQALELQRDALQAGAQAQLTQQALKRDEQLYAEGLIAESRLQVSRAGAAQAAAQASERRQGLALAGVAPGKVGGPLNLVAPIDGVVLEQGAQVGQRVEASTLIYRIAKLSPLWLEMQAPVSLAAGLKEGMAVKVTGSGVTGKLIAVGRAVEPGSQSVVLRAAVERGADSLRPGQVVEVEVAATGGGGSLRLPVSALVHHEGKTVVFVQGASNDKGTAFQAREVKPLAQSGDSAQVEGLLAGEKVAVKGVSGLKAVWTGVGRE